MAKSKLEETVNSLLLRVDSLEKEVSDLRQRTNDYNEKLEAFRASLGQSERKESEQPKRSSLIFR